MSLDRILSALAAQGMGDGRVVINVNAPVTINIGEPAEDSSVSMLFAALPSGSGPKASWARAEVADKAAQAEKERFAAAQAEEDKDRHPEDPDADLTPEAADRLLEVIASIPGNVTEEKLVRFARSSGFTEANARSLFAMWGRDRFTEFLAERGVELKKGRGDGYTKGSLRNAAKLDDLQPGCVRNYGPKMHELFMAVAAHA